MATVSEAPGDLYPRGGGFGEQCQHKGRGRGEKSPRTFDKSKLGRGGSEPSQPFTSQWTPSPKRVRLGRHDLGTGRKALSCAPRSRGFSQKGVSPKETKKGIVRFTKTAKTLPHQFRANIPPIEKPPPVSRFPLPISYVLPGSFPGPSSKFALRRRLSPILNKGGSEAPVKPETRCIAEMTWPNQPFVLILELNKGTKVP